MRRRESIVIGRIIVCSLLFSLKVAGQGRLDQLRQYLDRTAMNSVDSHYIEVPDKPWRIMGRYNMNAVTVDYSNTLEVPENNASADWSLRFEPPHASSVGFWVGYRGTGVSFSKSLSKNAGRYFSVSSTGAKYGFNFRLRRFSTSYVKLDATNYKNGEVVQKTEDEDDMPAPVWVRTAYLNGYYVFNGRRYSQAAAYNQSVVQRRSAGSLLLGATWFQSSFDYSDVENTIFMMLGNNLGRIKVHQANIGVGYGYNWVPLRGLVVNVMAMPTLSVYNRVKTYTYDSNYVLPLSKAQAADTADDYGAWNAETRTWANGKTHKPLRITDDDEGPQDIDSWEAGSETAYSWLHFNLDLRLGIAYNWHDWFVSFQAQYNNFRYSKDHCKVNIFDTYGRLSLGVRL